MRIYLVATALFATVACTKTRQPTEGSTALADSARKTTLEIALKGEEAKNGDLIPLDIAKLNKELKKAGLEGLPELLTISSNPGPFHKVIARRVEAAKEKLKRELRFDVIDYGHLYEMEFCYRGNVEDVPALIDGMVGNFLNRDQGILAMAAGKAKVLHDPAFKSKKALKERFGDEYENLEDTINLWFDYDSKSNAALVMSDYGANGDGTELEFNVIAACK